MIHGTLLHDMNQRNDKMQRIDRSGAPRMSRSRATELGQILKIPLKTDVIENE